MTAPEQPPTGVPEPPGEDPGDRGRESDPHHALNNPASDPDPTEWPDPYDRRDDPRGPAEGGQDRHPATGSQSTSQPHPSQDPEAEPWEGPKRDKVDE